MRKPSFFKKSSVGDLADAFKEFEFVAVDHPNIKKSMKLDMRLHIYEGNTNNAVALANYICAPPVTGDELVAFIYFADRCRDYCAFLLPITWVNPKDEIQRAWWGKKCLEEKAYMLSASAGKRVDGYRELEIQGPERPILKVYE
ncbi:hypothetical protein CYMTET_10348 [Cymbomonas tetramitiformis]|uniref:Uncharacterized protein n=1 Tax=Cymbomonas tetramitiformis TaxID=36881 RepID=A0AAE0GPI0_9CHLO|nr:hypothetical protein CYMTET_10348 [Cymbomonas tetramitiformis]